MGDWKEKNPLKHVSLYYEEFTLPYTGIEYGSNGEPIPNPKKNVFKKKSKAYDEFVDLVNRKKDWIANKKMPKQKDDDELARFMNKYEFERSQVQSKFRTILKSYNIADSTLEQDLQFHQQLLKRAPTSVEIYNMVKESPT